jgi:hypothetical protein
LIVAYTILPPGSFIWTHLDVVANFVFGHGYGITSSAKASQPCAALFYALFHLCAYSLKQHSRRQVCKVLLHPVCPFEEFGGDGLSVSGLESVQKSTAFRADYF